MNSAKLILRHDKKNNVGEAPIYLRVTKSRKHAYLSTGIRFEPKFWDDNKRKVKSHNPNSNAANTLIRTYTFIAKSTALAFEQKGKNYSAKVIKDRLLGKNSYNLVTHAYLWVEKRKSRGIISYSTSVKYKGVVQKMDDFCVGKLRIDEFDSEVRHQARKILRLGIYFQATYSSKHISFGIETVEYQLSKTKDFILGSISLNRVPRYFCY